MVDTSQRVLIVDDDVRTARLLARLLRDDGFVVELAADGAAAIARLARAPVPDALVTDLRMPHADGVAVARYARSRRSHIPVFIVTGYPTLVPRAVDEECPSGGDPDTQVFPKPLAYADLTEALRVALDRA
jgi:CheY-like chemotaxis protein